MPKYRLLRERLLAEGVLHPRELEESGVIDRASLLLAHTPEYLDAVFSGTLAADAQRRLGFSWSAALLARSRASVFGTVLAARAALDDGVAGNLAGGTHHAFADRGTGFCVFNDIAVAARALQREGLIERALVVDLDVHQGDGTAAIFADDPTVFTFSMHGANNFPFHKQRSSLDVELLDGCQDSEYIACLERHLPRSAELPRPRASRNRAAGASASWAGPSPTGPDAPAAPRGPARAHPARLWWSRSGSAVPSHLSDATRRRTVQRRNFNGLRARPGSGLPLGERDRGALVLLRLDLEVVDEPANPRQSQTEPSGGGKSVAQRLVDVVDARPVVVRHDLDALPRRPDSDRFQPDLALLRVGDDVARELRDCQRDQRRVSGREVQRRGEPTPLLTSGDDVLVRADWNLDLVFHQARVKPVASFSQSPGSRSS